MALRRLVQPALLGRTLESLLPASASASSHAITSLLQESCQEQQQPRFGWRTFASDAVTEVKQSGKLTPTNKLSMSPSHLIQYNEHSHGRFAPGTEGRPFAYFVLTGGRFLYASAVRLALLKVVLSLSAAADTMAVSSLEVDISGIEEGQSLTVKWRGKPVFIKHRTDAEIAEATSTALTELRDPQKDVDRAINPKYLIVVGICTHLGCVPIAGAGNFNGWFCPCHGSHYDLSGRIREGPAPYNLEVPEYRFTEAQKVLIG